MRKVFFAGAAMAVVFVVANRAIKLLDQPSDLAVAGGYFLLLTLVSCPSMTRSSSSPRKGLRFTTDVNVSYQLTASQVPKFYVRFRSDDLAGFTHGFFRDAVRNAFRVSTAYRAEEINGAKQSELIDRVLEQLRAAMQPYELDVLQLGLPRLRGLRRA